nr:immunoglobulin light chain junction region [Macaca mulatta]
CYQHSDGWTF